MVELPGEISVKPYSLGIKKDWDRVLENSINGTFLHQREFMEYHAHRFEDASLIIYERNIPIAIFPAEREGQKIYSHRGLSYAGWIISSDLDLPQLEMLVKSTLSYWENEQCQLALVRAIPDFYAKSPQQYLWQFIEKYGGKKKFTALHQVIDLPFRIKNKGKKWGKSKAVQTGLQIRHGMDIPWFWESLLIPNLAARHQVSPAHSMEEMIYLKNLFPHQIQSVGVYQGQEVLGGAVLFIHERVVHVQYIAALEEGRKYKCLDYLMLYLIEEAFPDKAFFSMGHSQEPQTGLINQGLYAWKKSLGAKAVEVNDWTFIKNDPTFGLDKIGKL